MNEKAVSWLLFLINPFISMLLAFKDYTQPYAKNIFWAFCTFYGFTFAIGVENSGSDINRYVQDLQFFYSQSELSFNDVITVFKESGEIDFVSLFITYLISRFSDSRSILIAVYAFIFGYFYSRNIWYIFGLLKGNFNVIVRILLLTLILIVPIWYINGIRMYLAFHVFIYGLLPYIFENNTRKLIYVYLSFLIHFSFMIPIGIFLAYRLIGNRIKILFFAFILSLMVSNISLGSINLYVERFLPERLMERTSAYRSEEAFEAKIESSKAKNKRWYVEWNGLLLRWSLYLTIIFLFFYGNSAIKKHPKWIRLFALVLIYFTSANFLLNVSSGARFMVFAYFLSLVMIVLYLNQFKTDRKFIRFIKLMSPAFLLFIIVAIRIGIYSFSITTIFGNPFIALFNINETMPLNDVIK